MLEPGLRVAGGHLQDAPLVPPPRAAHLDPRAAQPREVRGEGGQLLIPLVRLEENLARDGGRPVVLGDELQGDVLGPRLAVVIQEEGVAVHDLPLAHGEDLHAGGLALGVRPYGVEGVFRGDGRLLSVADVGEGLDLVAQLRSPLEVHVAGRLAHRVLADPDQAVHPSLEKGDDVGDYFVVLLFRHSPDAGRHRAPDVVVEAGHPAPASRLGAAALAKRERLVQDVERRAYGARAREGAEVAVARVVGGARGVDPRVLVAGGHHDVGVALVVLERGVKARAVALYQVRLEDQSLGLARRDDKVYLPDAPAELRYLRAPVAGAGKVARHPAPDVLGLAHVHDLLFGILEDVNAGGGREVGSVGESVLGHRMDYIAPGCLPRVSGACGGGVLGAGSPLRAGSCRPRRPWRNQPRSRTPR